MTYIDIFNFLKTINRNVFCRKALPIIFQWKINSWFFGMKIEFNSDQRLIISRYCRLPVQFNIKKAYILQIYMKFLYRI